MPICLCRLTRRSSFVKSMVYVPSFEILLTPVLSKSNQDLRYHPKQSVGGVFPIRVKYFDRYCPNFTHELGSQLILNRLCHKTWRQKPAVARLWRLLRSASGISQYLELWHWDQWIFTTKASLVQVTPNCLPANFNNLSAPEQ